MLSDVPGLERKGLRVYHPVDFVPDDLQGVRHGITCPQIDMRRLLTHRELVHAIISAHSSKHMKQACLTALYMHDCRLWHCKL